MFYLKKAYRKLAFTPRKCCRRFFVKSTFSNVCTIFAFWIPKIALNEKTRDFWTDEKCGSFQWCTLFEKKINIFQKESSTKKKEICTKFLSGFLWKKNLV